MFKRMLTICSAVALATVMVAQSAFAATANSSAIGYWMTEDHNNHNHPSSVIKITRGDDGKVSGKIVHIFAEAGHGPKDVCVKCSGKLHNTPIMGLQLVWGFHADPSTPGRYTGGYVLDPTNGKVYKCNMQLSDNGQKLTVHGYIGISLFGRSDTWYRTHFVKTAPKAKAVS